MTSLDHAIKMSNKQKIMWAITIVITLGVFLIPVSEAFTSQLRLYFAITVCAILLFAFELLDSFIVALALPVAYILTKLTDAGTAFSVWSNTTLWMMLGAMLLGNALERTGLLKRICYWLMLKAKGSFIKLIWAYFLAGVIANYCVSSGGIVLFCLISFSLIKSFGFTKDSNESAILMALAYFAGNSLPVCLSYGAQIDMYMNLGRKIIPDLSLGWFEYAIYNIAFLPFMILVIWVMYKFVLKPKTKTFDTMAIQKEYDTFGKISLSEKKAIIITVVTLCCLIFNAQLNLAVAWVFVIAGIICFLPGVNIADKECIRGVNFEMLFFMAGCLTIGTVGLNLGMAAIIKSYLASLMTGSFMQASAVVWIFAFLANKIMTPLAAGAAFCPAITQLCVDFGFNPVPIYLVMCNCFDNVLFPYESAPALMVYSFGMIKMSKFIKIMGVKALLNFVWILLIMVPYWALLGILY